MFNYQIMKWNELKDLLICCKRFFNWCPHPICPGALIDALIWASCWLNESLWVSTTGRPDDDDVGFGWFIIIETLSIPTLWDPRCGTVSCPTSKIVVARVVCPWKLHCNYMSTTWSPNFCGTYHKNVTEPHYLEEHNWGWAHVDELHVFSIRGN